MATPAAPAPDATPTPRPPAPPAPPAARRWLVGLAIAYALWVVVLLWMILFTRGANLPT